MNTNIWQRKLVAFLHDPPTKPLDLAEKLPHESTREMFLRAAGFDPETAKTLLPKNFDWTAAAADRFPFPNWQAFQRAGCATSEFRGDKDTPFRHPLGGSDYIFTRPFTAALAADHFQTIQKGILAALQQMPACDRDMANYFLHWRQWPLNSAFKDPRTYFLPADTRIPDHNIWFHNSIAAALTACMDDAGKINAAFLLFQLGPVQEFIAQARSTRDLWSGSYLLSWLAAHAIKAVTDEIGPDCVIFPSLRGQPIFDLMQRDWLYAKAFFDNGDGTESSLWERMKKHEKDMLTPNLPNRFFAIVPAEKAKTLAEATVIAVHKELERIAAASWDWFAEQGCPLEDAWRARFDTQIKEFPQITWQVYPWPEAEVSNLVAEFKQLDANAGAQLEKLHTLATKDIPEADRDERYFINKDPSSGQLNNRGFAWPYFYALTDRMFAARRNTRNFNQTALDDKSLSGATKDAWSGKEESIGSEEWWKNLAQTENQDIQRIFKPDDKSEAKVIKLGAINLVKKVWHTAYLGHPKQQWNLIVEKAVVFKSIPDIAAPKKYFAILALDGDEMGKWISGAKMPELQRQISNATSEYFRVQKAPKNISLDGIQRPLSPAYHAQFSEALSNFALYLARPIVEAFGGQLIYAGGDDVLAMLPADRVFDCAEVLRAAFRGDPSIANLTDKGKQLFKAHGTSGGFVELVNPKAGQPSWPLIVPGPNADVSVGIAIGHIKAPLQGLVRAAQAAEKRAKKNYGRKAFAVSLFKRSGEILEWGANWNSGALKIYHDFIKLSNAEPGEMPVFSNRFGYALGALLANYISGAGTVKDVQDFPLPEIIRKEFDLVFRQQSRRLDPKNEVDAKYIKLRDDFKKAASTDESHSYLASLLRKYKDKPNYIRNVINDFSMLFNVANFIDRKEED
ncbi:MAG: type III-B CRISPR-associated protein Cas10/Cmr2 [Kiritimatiellia bacterium]